MNKVFLHLGCGKRHAKGMINIDIQQYNGATDIIADITKDLPFEKNSVDLIYSCATLEHFDRKSWQNVLKYWFDLLKFGGRLQLSTVDFMAIVKRYKEEKNIEELVGLLLGGSKENSYMDRHGIIFDFRYLKSGLYSVGFKKVEKKQWQLFAPYMLDPYFDDFSRSYLPYMDFDHGRLMVLNVEATKE